MKNCVKYSGVVRVLLVLLVTASLLISCSREKEDQKQQESQTFPQKAEVGKMAPNFSLTDLQGNEWQLTDLRGKVVFLNFWATWCGPCVEEMPDMVALNKKMTNAPFKMITILNNDRPEFAAQMSQKVGATFPVLIDPDSQIGNLYGLTGVPETFIIDPQGVLREKFLGPRPWNSQGALDMLGQYMPR